MLSVETIRIVYYMEVSLNNIMRVYLYQRNAVQWRRRAV